MTTSHPLAERYLATIELVAGSAAKTLRARGDLSRSGSAESLAAATALLPAALARHRRKRGGALAAVHEVLGKYARPGALSQPRALLTADPRAPEPSPRLGGLLGDDGPRTAEFLARRSSDPPAVVGRALALSAPLVLAALAAAGTPEELGAWLAERGDAELADPAQLVAESGFPATAFRRIRTRGFPWWSRMLP